MFADDKQIGVGGNPDKGRYALYISQDLYRGASYRSEAYESETLSKEIDFKCRHIEVWALND